MRRKPGRSCNPPDATRGGKVSDDPAEVGFLYSAIEITRKFPSKEEQDAAEALIRDHLRKMSPLELSTRRESRRSFVKEYDCAPLTEAQARAMVEFVIEERKEAVRVAERKGDRKLGWTAIGIAAGSLLVSAAVALFALLD